MTASISSITFSFPQTVRTTRIEGGRKSILFSKRLIKRELTFLRTFKTSFQQLQEQYSGKNKQWNTLSIQDKNKTLKEKDLDLAEMTKVLRSIRVISKKESIHWDNVLQANKQVAMGQLDELIGVLSWQGIFKPENSHWSSSNITNEQITELQSMLKNYIVTTG